MSVLQVALDSVTVIVAVDPGKVFNRVWISDGSGLLVEPMSLPVSRDGIGQLERLLEERGLTSPVIAVEATGSLHRAWCSALERRHPGSVRVFAPSETKSARTQLGSGRFKTDDRDCAALTYMARQGGGRRFEQHSAVEELRAAVRHRRGLVADRKVVAQRLHDQLNALCRVVGPRWSWTVPGAGYADRPGGIGMRGGVRGTAATSAVGDMQGSRTTDHPDCPVLGDAVARVSAAAG